MKALVWHGKNDVRVERVPDPSILNPRDAIIRITTSAICGSDLHLLDGYIPTMQSGDILGHEFMGEVVDVGPGNRALKRGDRVVVPFTIACGGCYFCKNELWSCCDNSNPNAGMAEKLYGYSTSGLFGYSHLTGGYAGGQAQYARVPFADVGPLKIPDGIPDEKVLFLSDILPTGYMAAENCEIKRGDTIAVWLRARRADGDQERVAARRRARDRDRLGPRTPEDGAGREHGRGHQLRGGGRLRLPQDDDRRARAG